MDSGLVSPTLAIRRVWGPGGTLSAAGYGVQGRAAARRTLLGPRALMGIPRPSEAILVVRVRAFVSRRRDPPAPSHARAGTTPSSALGGLVRMYDPPRAVFDFSGLSGLD